MHANSKMKNQLPDALFVCAAPVFRGPGQVETLLQLPSSAAGEIRHDGSGAEAGTGGAQGVSVRLWQILPHHACFDNAAMLFTTTSKLKQVLLLLYIVIHVQRDIDWHLPSSLEQLSILTF